MKKIVLVTTVATFRHTYAFWEDQDVDGKGVCDYIGSSNIDEMSQEFLGETVVTYRDVDVAEYLKVFDRENDYLKDWDSEKKINMIMNPEVLDQEDGK